tara:strand:- start:461 stop:1768 length:1308 start_codon:yes stop_codon:yes gene_type:complete
LVIVENQKEFSKFSKEFHQYDSVTIPIQCDENKHPIDTKLCLLYVKMLDGDLNEYVLPFRHTDSINLDPEKYTDLSWSPKNKYTYDKKKLLHFFDWKNVYDVQINHYLKTNEPLQLDDVSTNAHEYFYRKYYNKTNVNCIIPIMKHIEWCRKMVDKIKLCVFTGTKETESTFNIYNSEVLESLQSIESNGLQTLDGMVYSEYNPYTATGRPSNRFGGINFAALNKKDGSRKQFISRFGKDGMLVEMDYDAYHLRLIGEVVNYKFPKGSVHQHMAKLYGVDYNEAKGLSFQYLYGHIPDEVVKSNPFFAKVQVYIDEVWKRYKSNNFIESDIYNKRIYRENLSDMNKNKVFNYLIQLMETESNMKMLTELIPKIDGYKSKLILYSYDSFLFDFHLQDGLGFLKKVKGIIEQSGKFPVKVGKGWNYHEMKDITGKFK